MISILGARGAIGNELGKLLAARIDSGKFAREFGFAGTPYAEGIKATAASLGVHA